MRHFMWMEPDSMIMFDDETKKFSLYVLVEDTEISHPVEYEDAENVFQNTDDEIKRCGKCQKIGHTKSAHDKPPTRIKCLDCKWEGETLTRFMDATCPDGHIHIQKL